MAQPIKITLEPLTEQEGEKPLFTPPAEITPEQAAAENFEIIVGRAMELPEGFQPPEVGPYTDIEATKANIPITLEPVAYESTEPGTYEQILGKFLPDKTQAALAQGVEAAGEKYVKPAYDWLTTSPKFVRDAVKAQEKKIDEILEKPPVPAGEDVVVDPMLGIMRSQALPDELSRETAKLAALKVGEAVSSPIDMASMAMGGVGPAVTRARYLGRVSAPVEKTVRGVDLGVQATAATPAVVEAVKAINEAVADPTAGNIAGATASTFLAAFAGPAVVDAFRATGTRISDRDYVVSDAQWEAAQNRMRAAQMTDADFSAARTRPLELPEGLPQIDTARTPEGDFIRTVIPSEGTMTARPPLELPASRPPAEEFVRTVIPSGETIQVQPPRDELAEANVRSVARTKEFNERVKRITETFREDGIVLKRDQAVMMANITDPREYSLTRQAILDTMRPLPQNSPEARQVRKATSLKGFEELTPEMVGQGSIKLYRGTKPEWEGAPTVGDALFMSPDRKVAEAYAGKTGKVTEQDVTFNNLLEADTWIQAKSKLGLARDAGMDGLIRAARAQGYDGLSFTSKWGREYVVIPPAKKAGVVAGEVPVLEKAAPAPEPLVPLPVSPRRIELEPLIYDSGLVDEVGNPVFVNEAGAPVDPRKYQDPREVVRTPQEQVLYDQQLDRRIDLERKSTAIELVEKLPKEASVTVRLPEADAPVPATFLGRVPDSAGFSRVATSEGEIVVPNVDITAAPQAPAAAAAMAQPIVTKVKDPTIGGWDVQLGPNKYRIFRDPENRWWYLDAVGHYSGRVLSVRDKADAIKNLIENEAFWIKSIEQENLTIAKIRARTVEAKATPAKAAAKATVPAAPLAPAPAEVLKPGLDTKMAEVEVALSVVPSSKSTGKMPGLDKLNKESQTDPMAARLLSDIAADTLRFLFQDVPTAKVDYIPAIGLYGGELEGSLRMRLTFNEADRAKVLVRLSRFAKNFDQEQIHMRLVLPEDSLVGQSYGDGSYNTSSYTWKAKGLERPKIEQLAKESGLYGFTVSNDQLLAYYVGDPNDLKAITQFKKSAEKVSKSLGRAVGRVERLWVYGRGGIKLPDIRGGLPVAASESNAIAQRIASRLASREVKALPQDTKLTPEIKARGVQIAKAYGEMPMDDLSTNWKTRRAYEELSDEIIEQFAALPIKVEIWRGDGQPYKNSKEMRTDILQRNHLYIFGTDAKSFGPEGIVYDNHPLLEKSDFTDMRGRPLLVNDLFRAVHDYYAHTLSPVQFGPLGETAAHRNHMLMTRSPWARWAMTSETLGQNNYVNFGPDGEFNRANPAKTKYAPQKTALLPIEFTKIGDPMLDAEMDAIGKMKKPEFTREGKRKISTERRRGALNLSLLSALGESSIGSAIGFAYGYNKDSSASTADRIINGFMWGALGAGVANTKLRNAVFDRLYKARIPIKFMGPGPQKLLGGMDNWPIFVRSGLEGMYDVIKGERMLAESIKDAPLKALDALEKMRPGTAPSMMNRVMSKAGLVRPFVAATPGDWTAVGDFLANRASPMLILNKELRAQAKLVRSTLDDFSRVLIQTGIATPGTDLHDTIVRNMGEYLTRTYKIFTDPNFEYDPANVVRAATEYATQLKLEKDPRPFSDLVNEGQAQAAYQMAKVKGTGMEPARSFAQGNGIARVDGSILKPRKELSEAWAEMLGIEKDPIRSAAITVDRMADMIAARATQFKIVEVGLELGLLSRRFGKQHSIPMTPESGRPISSDPSAPLLPNDVARNPLDGLFTTPEVRDGMYTLRAYQSASAPLRALSFLTAGVKIGKTALHPISVAPNFLSAASQPLVQGHLIQAMFHPGIYRDAFSISFNTPFPSNAAKIKSDIPMLIREGILKQDVNLNDLVETAQTAGYTDVGNKLVTWFPKLTAIPKGLIKGALWTYGKVEEFPRLISFYAEVGRYSWAMFGKTMDDLAPEELALVYRKAVDVTKRVYPNSQMVPEVVKKFSTTGALEPFVAYKWSVFQTAMETVKTVKSDINEGRKTGNPRMIQSGVVRLTGLIGALYGAYWMNEALNQINGVSGEQDKALRRRLPDWDRTGMLIVPTLTPEEVAYANQSYLLPQSLISSAIKAGLEGADPVQAGAAFIKETAGSMVSDGGLILKPVMEAVTGFNEYGRRIYPRDGGKYVDVSEIQADAVRNAATGGQNLVTGAMHVLKSTAPGFITEGMKWYKSAREEVGPDGQIYKPSDLGARLMGVRLQRINLPLQFERQAGELFSRVNDARTEFGRARNRKDATPESIETAYQMSEQSRRIVYRDLVQYLDDAKLLGQDREATVRMLQRAGVPSDFLLGAINRIYVPGAKEKEVSARDQFEAMKLLPEAKQMAEWTRIQMEDPKLAKQFQKFGQEAARGVTSEVRMLQNLDEDNGQRARMIAQLVLNEGEDTREAKLQEFRNAGLIKGETGRMLFGDSEAASKIWAEADVLLRTGKNPNFLPLPSSSVVEGPPKPAEPPKRATPPVQSAPQENVFRDSQTGKLWRQLPDGRYEEVTQPPPVPGKKTSFIEGRLYRDPTTGVMKVYRNGQFV